MTQTSVSPFVENYSLCSRCNVDIKSSKFLRNRKHKKIKYEYLRCEKCGHYIPKNMLYLSNVEIYVCFNGHSFGLCQQCVSLYFNNTNNTTENSGDEHFERNTSAKDVHNVSEKDIKHDSNNNNNNIYNDTDNNNNNKADNPKDHHNEKISDKNANNGDNDEKLKMKNNNLAIPLSLPPDDDNKHISEKIVLDMASNVPQLPQQQQPDSKHSSKTSTPKTFNTPRTFEKDLDEQANKFKQYLSKSKQNTTTNNESPTSHSNQATSNNNSSLESIALLTELHCQTRKIKEKYEEQMQLLKSGAFREGMLAQMSEENNN